jgi:GT2 family glycosyltransferase
MKQVSVIIRTTGTTEKLVLLAKTLKSLSKQSFKNFELIIATETNYHAVKELVRKYFQEYDNAIVIETNAWNRCKTTNQGLRLSKGDLIAILDDDMILERRWLEKLVKSFNIAPKSCGCIFSNCESPWKEGAYYTHRSLAFVATLLSRLSIPSSLFPKRSKYIGGFYEAFTLPVTCAIFKRRAIFSIGPTVYDEKLREPMRSDDYDLGFRMRKKGWSILANFNTKAFHIENYRLKWLTKPPQHFEGLFLTEIYVYAKHLDIVGIYLLPQLLYTAIEALLWSIRTRKLKVILRGIRGIMLGLIQGLNEYRQNKPYERNY